MEKNMFQTTNQIVIDVGKTINNPPVITIFIGGMVTIPSIGKKNLQFLDKSLLVTVYVNPV
jgi:hypothetical protein